MSSKPRIGLALSGGGARGIAHIGVIKALKEGGIEPKRVAGTSAGAIAGVLWASGMSAEDMLEFVRKTSVLKLIRAHIPYTGLISLQYLKERMQEVVPGDRFEDLQHPLSITTTNLLTGKCEYFSTGPLSDMVCASSAIPLIFKPVKWNDRIYVDGGVVNNLPVDGLRGKVDLIIGVNVMPEETLSLRELTNLFQVGTRTFELSILANSRESMKKADLIIEPKGLRLYSMFNMSKYEEIHQLGYEAGQQALPAIREMIRSRGKEEHQSR